MANIACCNIKKAGFWILFWIDMTAITSPGKNKNAVYGQASSKFIGRQEA
jgi:hypothetical protein